MTDTVPILLNYFSLLGLWRSIYNSPRIHRTADVELLKLLKAYLLMQAGDQKQEYKLEGPNIALHNEG